MKLGTIEKGVVAGASKKLTKHLLEQPEKKVTLSDDTINQFCNENGIPFRVHVLEDNKLEIVHHA